MMHWNVTYNDPNRWNEVHAICGPKWPWLDGIRQVLKGKPLGSPKLDLVRLEGLDELQAMRKDLGHRTPVNFLRTTGGIMAFTKVRLEVYAVPIRRQELQSMQIAEASATGGRPVLEIKFERDNHQVTLAMEGSEAAVNRMENWLRLDSML
tara:strand:- start:1823 stop:2275 length:453 start_codon:yes stop_codon:yes gene_type:complete